MRPKVVAKLMRCGFPVALFGISLRNRMRLGTLNFASRAATKLLISYSVA
jgi:hypothetical protein